MMHIFEKKGINPGTHPMYTRQKQTALCYSEHYEFAESENQCKNKHSPKAGSTPGAFVYSCSHGLVLGQWPPSYHFIIVSLMNKFLFYLYNSPNLYNLSLLGITYLTEVESVRHAYTFFAE